MESFPGFDIDEIAARKFGRVTARVNLPPIALRRGRHAGFLPELHPPCRLRRRDGDASARRHRPPLLRSRRAARPQLHRRAAAADGLLRRRGRRLGTTDIIARPNGWPRSRSCSAMQALLIEAAHWGLALIPVLVLLAVFVWLDAFELMSLREILVLLLMGGLGGARSPGLSAGDCSTRCRSAFRTTAASSRRGSRKRSRRAIIDRPLPDEPHRLQARRGHLRLRHRRRFLGRREHLST